MIGKLRMKLIAASMLSLLAVLLCIEGGIGGINYKKIVEDADRVLEVLGENEGRFPQTDLFAEKKRKKPRWIMILFCLQNFHMSRDIFRFF